MALAPTGQEGYDSDGDGTNESSVLTDDPTGLRVSSLAEIPTLSTAGILALLLLLVTVGVLKLQRST